MPIPKRILKHLDQNKIKYEVVAHRTVYTAYDLAQTLKARLDEIAKTLMVKADKEYILVVIPAHYRIDLKKLKKALEAKKVEICKEGLMKKIFKVKPGAITPFGKIHKAQVVADKGLLKTRDVILGAGSFTESLRLKIEDFMELEEAKLANFSEKAKFKLQKPIPKKKPKKKRVTKKKK